MQFHKKITNNNNNNTNTDIRIDNLLVKRSTTKEKLAVWLETVCCILDQHAIPWLEKAAPLSDEVEKLKSENIADQKTVISL